VDAGVVLARHVPPGNGEPSRVDAPTGAGSGQLGAEGLRERIGAELLPFLQQTQDCGAALALGDHAFEAAVADGRKLSRAPDDHRDGRTGRERGRARANHR
jgi:hypothetical protein